MATRRLRSYFFTTSGDTKIGNFWTRLVGGGISKPTQLTFEDLLESCAVHNESNSSASTDSIAALGNKQGLVILSTDANAKSGTNTALGSTGGSIVVQPSQLPTTVGGSGTVDTIANTINNFSGAALDSTVDATSTRNNYVITFTTAFKTWLTNLINSINTSLGTLTTSIGTVATNLATLGTTVGTNTTNITTLGTKVLPAGGTTGQVLSKIDNTNYNAGWTTNAAAGDTFKTTSTTSLVITNNTTRVFTVAAGLAIGNGTRMRASSNASGANYMEGSCTYSGTTLTMTVDRIGGSGTLGDWNINIGDNPVRTKVLSIGDWNMDLTPQVTIAHGLGASWLNIVSIKVMIIQDGNVNTIPLDGSISGGTVTNGRFWATSTLIVMERSTSQDFDSTNYDATSFNRGFIIIQYTD